MNGLQPVEEGHVLANSSYANLVTWLTRIEARVEWSSVDQSLCLESFVWPWLRFYGQWVCLFELPDKSVPNVNRSSRHLTHLFQRSRTKTAASQPAQSKLETKLKVSRATEPVETWDLALVRAALHTLLSWNSAELELVRPLRRFSTLKVK